MKINVYLSTGPFDGATRTIYRQEAPMDLRITENVSEMDAADTVEVSVYRVMRVDPMPIQTLGVQAMYVYQGTRPSAWSLVDFVV